ncbi:MAG TPA: hypothetical protein VHE34_06385 [Puia sp.]|uniref:hypothetical protein n=1 Tax=Puia sp. TaxID=2045100 RepID=UPI002BDFF893|nr:hypothetical protein [Puia sp.]HVU94832.1 hypothetical protein [Puia sp.]
MKRPLQAGGTLCAHDGVSMPIAEGVYKLRTNGRYTIDTREYRHQGLLYREEQLDNVHQ